MDAVGIDSRKEITTLLIGTGQPVISTLPQAQHERPSATADHDHFL